MTLCLNMVQRHFFVYNSIAAYAITFFNHYKMIAM